MSKTERELECVLLDPPGLLGLFVVEVLEQPVFKVLQPRAHARLHKTAGGILADFLRAG